MICWNTSRTKTVAWESCTVQTMIRNKEILGDWTLPERWNCWRCGIFLVGEVGSQYPTKRANVPWKNRGNWKILITFRLEFVCSYLGDIRSFSGMYTFLDPKVHPRINILGNFVEASRQDNVIATLSWVRENPKVELIITYSKLWWFTVRFFQ